MVNELRVNNLEDLDFTTRDCKNGNKLELVLYKGIAKMDFDFFDGAKAVGGSVYINDTKVTSPYEATRVAHQWIEKKAKAENNKQSFLNALSL